MLRKSLLFLSIPVAVSLAVADVSGAQVGARPDTVGGAQKPWGNWSARTAEGAVLGGTWTALPDAKSGTVTGTWTIVDAQGKAVVNGAWSAAKAPTAWSGAWRAVVAGKTEEYTGTFTAGGDLKTTAGFGELFEKAIEGAMSGTWQRGKQNGAWSIRAAKPDMKP